MIRAMIFNLDGTLGETEQLKAYSYARAALELNTNGLNTNGLNTNGLNTNGLNTNGLNTNGLTEAQVIDSFKEVVGLSRRQVAMYLLERFDLEVAARTRMDEFMVNLPWQAYIQLHLRHYEEMLLDPNLLWANRYPHNISLLKEARQTLGKTGLATMSYCPQVRRVLEVLEINDHFNFIASRDDVENGKPDPEIYHLVAKELQVAPHETLVIEDSPTGVKAALNAGMHCIAVTTDFTRNALRTKELLDVRWIVDDPTTLPVVVQRLIDEQGSK